MKTIDDLPSDRRNAIQRGLQASAVHPETTGEAIAYCNEIAAKFVLVLCPVPAVIPWMERIRDLSTMAYPYVVYPILHGRYGVHPTAAWTIVSYGIARRPFIYPALVQRSYDAVIFDIEQPGRTAFEGGYAELVTSLAASAAEVIAVNPEDAVLVRSARLRAQLAAEET